MGMLGEPDRLRNDLCRRVRVSGRVLQCDDYEGGAAGAVGVVCVPEDAGRDVASTTNGNHQIRVKLIENALR